MDTDSSTRQGRWLWLLPRLALVLFVASVATQLWLTERAATQEERAALISDMLWLEQSLRFQLRHNEESFATISDEDIQDANRFQAIAIPLLNNGTGLSQVLVLDAQGRLLQRQPAREIRVDGQTAERAHSLAKAAYSPPYRDPSGEWLFQVHVPIFRVGQTAHLIVGIYSLDKLLKDGVPWWLVQRNHIGIKDLAGTMLARRSKMDTQTSALTHQIQFDPPGQGMTLWASPIRPPKSVSGMLLSASLVFLAAAVLWSLWALRRHMQHRAQAEQALREQYAFRQAMENSLQTGLRARDLTGRITYVNPAFCRMVGWTAEDLVGQSPPLPYWLDEEIEIAQAWNARILAGQAPPEGFEIRFRRRNGEIFWALIHEAPLMDMHGQHTGWMSSVVDITESKLAQDHARQQQERLQASARLIAMGEMASSLAHELNQPLAAISSYAAGSLNLMEGGQAPQGELQETLGKIQAQAQRAGRIIRRIYDFVRRAEPKSESFDLGQVVNEIADLVEVDARRKKICIQRDISTELPAIQGDRVLLGQALLNLMRNGVEAMETQAKRECALTVRAWTEGDQIRVSIADRGPGIPDDVAKQMFAPFFTTKPEGMGMGLNICRSIVEAHQGRLELLPNPDGGSIFIISLPVHRP